LNLLPSFSVFSSGRCNGSSSAHATIGEFLLLFRGFQDLEAAHECVVDWHHGTCIVELATIVGSWEKSDELALGKELITVFHDLMGSADKVNVVLLVEGRDDFLTKSEGYTTVVLTPTLDIFVGIWPKEITEKAGIRNVCGSHNSLDLFKRRQLWWKTSVHAQDLLINDCGNRETVEAISEGFPQFNVVASLALVVKSIDSVDWCALVVSSQQEEVFRVLDLVSQEKADSLKRLFTSVDIIPEEEIISIRGETSIFEKSE
jgi:hypothetical protein